MSILKSNLVSVFFLAILSSTSFAQYDTGTFFANQLSSSYQASGQTVNAMVVLAGGNAEYRPSKIADGLSCLITASAYRQDLGQSLISFAIDVAAEDPSLLEPMAEVVAMTEAIIRIENELPPAFEALASAALDQDVVATEEWGRFIWDSFADTLGFVEGVQNIFDGLE